VKNTQKKKPQNKTLMKLTAMIPTWSQLSAIGRNRLFRSSYFWIVFVPLVAKLTSTIPERIKIPWVETSIELNASLPFSWTVFYFSAVFFALGSVLYSVFCPHIIKTYRNFAEFLEHGEGGKYLYGQAQQHLNDTDSSGISLAHIIGAYFTSKYKQDELIEFLKLNDINFYIDDITSEPARLDFSPEARLLLSFPKEHLENVFSFLKDHKDNSRRGNRLACCILYTLGFGLLTIVLIQNFGYVCSQFDWSNFLPLT